jgi:CheY-like chemotaxis protein
LIDDLLDVSRIVAGKLRLDVQSVQPAHIVEAAMASVRPAADAKGVRIVHALDPDAGPVNGDPHRLQQIVWNLLSNAVKFTPRGGLVQVALQRSADDVQVTVSDNGIGIAPAFVPYVFDRFRQADASTTRRFGGLGLGLGIARHLAELHGGTMSAKSPGEGKGAVFTLTLPVAVAKAPVHAPPRRRAQDIHSLAGVRVLLVEDDADARDLLIRTLGDAGASVWATSSAAEAIGAFRVQQPDVIISDIGMPDEDGYSLIARIRALGLEHGGAVPAVALTALARPEDRRRAVLAGFQMHVAKPVEPAELTRIVADLVAGHKQEVS